MAWKCPHCEGEIENVDYSVNITQQEYGRADLTASPRTPTLAETDNHECNDCGGSEWDGDPTYMCPLCNQEIEIRDLTPIGEEETPEDPNHIPAENEELNETRFSITKPQNQIITTQRIAIEGTILFCAKCKTGFASDLENGYFGEHVFQCPKCERPCTQEETKMLLEEGFTHK